MKLSQLRNVHFVGIAGAGVSGLARIALQAGARVSGSDLVSNPTTRALTEAGAAIHADHHRDHVPPECQLVVISAAIKKANPEYREAARQGIRIMKYAEALGELTRAHTNLCIAGTHGKTTTTAMLAQMMVEGGKEPGYLIGGEPASLPAASAAGSGVNFVIESCEYDRSFLRLHPGVIVLNNIELDHMDVYGDIEGVINGFVEFAKRLPRRGTLFYNADDPHCAEVAKRAACSTIGFGESCDAVWRLHNVDTSTGFAIADVTCRGMQVGRMELQVPGRVNTMNALGALAAANWAGIPVNRALKALQNFGGVKRRFEIVGSVGGVPLVDDYAHHPTAVKQLIETTRAAFINRRVVAVFQAHQYQRILGFFDGFVDALKPADRVLVARTYAAREEGIQPGVHEERLARTLRQDNVDAMSYGDFSGIIADLTAKTTPRDVILFIGAGDVNEIAFEMLKRRDVISSRLRAVRHEGVAA
ncbi:MAG: UDP-N-acetylmuramate--L-alanine ligase [Planctomycetes bacterium]|nr:UDP-N-acetylmuramate--L-alanine ligase [Planctomycetota bacterium]